MSGRELETGRRLAITGEQRVDVVGAAGSRLGDHREVGRQRPVIGGARGLRIGEGRAEPVRRTSGALNISPLSFGPSVTWTCAAKRLDRFRREFRAALLAEIAVGEQPHRMAVRANLLIDLVAALELGVVEGAERAGEGPVLRGDARLLVADLLASDFGSSAARPGRAARQARAEETRRSQAERRHFDHSTGSGMRRRGAGSGGAGASSGPSTDSVMLPGSARGFSIQPTTGMTTRKNRK